MRIGFAANPVKAETLLSRDTLLQLAASRGFDTVSVGDSSEVRCAERPIGVLVVVGGDGSLLRYADAASVRGIPLLGVNLGRVGFLSELPKEAFSGALTRLRSGDYTVEKRMMLRCTINDDVTLHCLNDVVVFKQTFSGVTEVTIRINGDEVGTVFCDGVIAASPTGSTAYSLSAGGSILTDGLNAISVTTVCPHTLHIRPIVTAADSDIRFSVADSGVVSVDGMRIREVHRGDHIHVTGADRTADFIRFGRNDLFRLIREKLS